MRGVQGTVIRRGRDEDRFAKKQNTLFPVVWALGDGKLKVMSASGLIRLRVRDAKINFNLPHVPYSILPVGSADDTVLIRVSPFYRWTAGRKLSGKLKSCGREICVRQR